MWTLFVCTRHCITKNVKLISSLLVSFRIYLLKNNLSFYLLRVKPSKLNWLNVRFRYLLAYYGNTFFNVTCEKYKIMFIQQKYNILLGPILTKKQSHKELIYIFYQFSYEYKCHRVKLIIIHSLHYEWDINLLSGRCHFH